MNIQRILFGTDFSEASEPAFRVAVSLARDNSAKLIILYVSDSEDYPIGEHINEDPKPPCAETDKLKELLSQVERVPCEWRWEHREEPHHAEAIVEIAEEENADMIVVGTHGRQGLSHLLMGSVAEKVIRQADCPVLCVRHVKPAKTKD